MATRELPQADKCSSALNGMALIKKLRYSLRVLLASVLTLALVLAIYREPLRRRIEALLGTRRQTNWIVIAGRQTSGTPAALDPPDPQEIIRAFHGTKMRINTDIRMVIEPIADYVDPPVHTSTAATYQLHHASYKCQLIFIGGGARTIYIDHQHRCVP